MIPSVSVIIPTHNRPEFLAEALASVRAQTFTDYQIIVVSNGETAKNQWNSHGIALKAGAQYFALAEGNVSKARNFGVARTNSKWIAFLDDDDLWPPDALANLTKGSADLIAGDVLTFGSETTLMRQRVPRGWTYHKAAAHSKWYSFIGAFLIRREVFNAVLFDPDMVLVEDTDFWRRVAQGHSIEQISSVVLHYRKGHPSASGLRAREWACARHYLKMRRDTPAALRGDVPGMPTLARRWILRNIMPTLLRQPRKTWAAMKGRFCRIPQFPE